MTLLSEVWLVHICITVKGDSRFNLRWIKLAESCRTVRKVFDYHNCVTILMTEYSAGRVDAMGADT